MYKYYEVLNQNMPDDFMLETTFDVAGLFSITPLLIELVNVVKRKIGFELPITSIYGCPSLIWNGGRIVLNDYGRSKMEGIWKEDIELLQEHNISPVITFSNHMIIEDDLEDESCNRLLELLYKNNGEGSVRISSDILKKYIKQRYPMININASVIKVEIENGQGNLLYYKKLEKEFYKYVVHPNDNFNYELLKHLDKAKAEILINERCYMNCPQRTEHYNAIANIQKGIEEEQDAQEKVLAKCAAIPERKQIYSNIRNISLKIKELENLYKLGFRNFKLQGRTDNLYVFFYDIIRYIIKDEFMVSQIYIPFCDLIRRYENGIDIF